MIGLGSVRDDRVREGAPLTELTAPISLPLSTWHVAAIDVIGPVSDLGPGFGGRKLEFTKLTFCLKTKG